MGYKKTFSEVILNLLQTNLSTVAPFKQYFDGDPVAIPQTLLPCVCVLKTATDYKNQPATGTEERTHSCTIRLVFNKKDEFGKSSNEVVLQKTAENIVEGVNETNNQLHENSIMGVLRRNYTFGGFSITNEARVDYGISTSRPDLITFEVDITINADERLLMPTRS